MKKDNEIYLQELLMEIQECREDERSRKNEIMQVITAGITALGVLFGASFWDGGDKSLAIIGFEMTVKEVIFYLSILVFTLVFSYLIVIGTENVLRYYYVQNLEDRLYQLSQKTDFLHWGSFSGPIITRNINHITSSHTLLVFIAYSLATLVAILFCAAIVLILYYSIDDKSIYAIIVLHMGMVSALFSSIVFVRTSVYAKRMAIHTQKTALDNRKRRMKNQKTYADSKHFWHKILYFIYPKYTDIQKPILTCGVFVLFGLYFDVFGENRQVIWNLVFSVLVIEILAYQARYQINDLLGIKEDETVGKKHRISSLVKKEKHLSKLSLKIAVAKILLAVFIAVLCTVSSKGNGKILLIELAVLIIITVIYEYVRKKEYSEGVYFWVGSGYAFRLVVGILAANPHVWKESIFGNTGILEICLKILLIVGFWSYGISASTLPWASSVCNRMNQYQGELERTGKIKKHDIEICFLLKERYNKATSHKINNKIMPLRERGKLCDVWNVSHLCAVVSLGIIVTIKLLERQQYNLIGLELATFLIAILYVCCVKYKGLAVFIGIETILIVLKIVFSWIINPSTGNIVIYLFLFEGLFVVTYFILRYEPQMKKIDFRNRTGL